MATNDGDFVHNLDHGKVRHLLTKLQKVILNSVVADDVQCLEECIETLNEYKSLFDVSNKNKTSIGLLDFFPDQVEVKVRKQYRSHSPLMIACESNREEIIEKLLDNGASVALKNKFGLTAAHIVCKQGNLSIFKKLLLAAETQKIFCGKKNSNGKMLSSDREVALMTRAKKGWYPVMFAVQEGHIDFIKECFQDEHLKVTSKKKKTVLHIAARAAHFSCLQELMSRVSEDLTKATDKKGWNILHHACAGGSLEVLQWLVENIKSLDTSMLNQKSKCHYTPLLTACEYKKVELVKYLLSLGDVNVTVTATNDSSDTETTDKALQMGRTALHIAAAHNSAQIVHMLIEKKCPLSIQDEDGNTPLHYAYRRSSTEAVNVLEQLNVDGVLLKDKPNKAGDLPSDVKPIEVIPLEIRRRGQEAIEIYKRVLKKGSRKLPRCNLLILGEETVGKTSLYRLLVRKRFKENQVSTRGIDNNEVNIVDERSVTMGDEWEEKPRENQGEQANKKFIECVSETLHEELPPADTDKRSVGRETVLLEQELRGELTHIRRMLKVYSKETEASVDKTKNTSPPQAPTRHSGEHVYINKPSEPKYEKQSKPHDVPQREKPVEKRVTSSFNKEVKTVSRAQNVFQQGKESSPATSTPPPEKLKSVPPPDHPPEESIRKQKVESPKISRKESEDISSRLKDKKKQSKKGAKVPPKLELKALDFAGQKHYRPMHHCFITRRAMYLVVFNLKKMIDFIESNEPSSSPSPIEQIRYWLYSIHAHIFPPEEGDNLRRVCLVGTHKKFVTEEQIEKINERLKSEFRSDDRCINLFHYMGSSNTEKILATVENSIDGDRKDDRKNSGAAFLQKELNLVTHQLNFLDEQHPLIWLKFEQELIKMRETLTHKNLPLFVTVEEVKKVAESQGIYDDRSCDLALDFFHDTGKIVCLKRVPTLYLDAEERNELAELIILDPAWLSKVMRVIVELRPSDFDGDRRPAVRLVDEGIASKLLLMKLWREFLPIIDKRDHTFHNLCTILKAYCLVYPLKDLNVSSLKDRKQESLLPNESGEAEVSTSDSSVLILSNGQEMVPLSGVSQEIKLPTPDSTTADSTLFTLKNEFPLPEQSAEAKLPTSDSTELSSIDKPDQSIEVKLPTPDSTEVSSRDKNEELQLPDQSNESKLPAPDSTTESDKKGELPLSSASQKTELHIPEKQTPTCNDLYLVPCILPKDIKDRQEDNNLNWIVFFFDFEKFLPEVVFHRFICQLIAATQRMTSENRSRPQFSKSWCRFYRINGCNWKIELLTNIHRLKISVLTKDTDNLSQHIDYIHENYLKEICEKSEFQGLKYHGGPLAKCECSKKVLEYVSFPTEEAAKDSAESASSGVSKLVECVRCLTEHNVDHLLSEQKRSANQGKVQAQSTSSSGADSVSSKPTLKLLMRSLKKVASDWEDLGIELEIEEGELKRIRADNPRDSNACLRELLRTWLKRTDPEPTWEAIAEAVEHGVKDEELTSKIRAEYCQHTL